MNNRIFAALAAASLICMTSCGNTSSSESTSASADNVSAAADSENTASSDAEAEEIDLTEMDASMVYAQVFDMVNEPDDYVGKRIIAKGPFSYFQDELSGNEYFAVLINDATACCAQGIEFVLDGEHSYPEDYPELNSEVTVTGEFNYYKEDYITYCQLLHASIKTDDGLSWS